MNQNILEKIFTKNIKQKQPWKPTEDIGKGNIQETYTTAKS